MRHIIVALALLAFAVSGLPATAEAKKKLTPKEEVIQFEKEVEDFLNSEEYLKHPENTFRYFDDGPGSRFFDVMEPLQHRGKEFRDHWIKISNSIEGKVTFYEMEVEANDNIAYVTYLQHFVGKDKSGQVLDLTIRTTDGLLKRDGKWKLLHQHMSVPLPASAVQSAPAAPAEKKP